MIVKSSIEIQVPEEIIKSLEEKLNGIKNPESAVKTLINNTAKQVQRMLAQKAAKEYTGKVAKKSAIMASSDIKKATTSSQITTICFQSPVHEIKDFHISSLAISRTYYRKNGMRGGKKLKAKILNGSSKTLENAFVVQFKSGHISVVRRKAGTKMDSNPKKEKLEKLLSPSYKVMIGGKRVYGESSDEIGVIMHTETEKMLEKILGG